MVSSIVKTGLVNIDASIASGKKRAARLREEAQQIVTDMNSLPATYSEAISEIQGYTVPTEVTPENVSEADAIRRLADATTEFQAFVSALNTAIDALGE